MLPNNNDTITTLHQGFGDTELKSTLSRQIVWMELSHFSSLLKDKKMHIRLKDTQMYHTIDKLKHNIK